MRRTRRKERAAQRGIALKGLDELESKLETIKPRYFTEELGKQICAGLMTAKSLKSLCENNPDFPSASIVFSWLANPAMASFKEAYYEARRIQAESRVDDIFEIAEDISDDWLPVDNKDGDVIGYRPKHSSIHRARLRIDTTKWFAARMVPKIYGDKIDVEHGITGDLQQLLESASNKNSGLPDPVDSTCERIDDT